MKHLAGDRSGVGDRLIDARDVQPHLARARRGLLDLAGDLRCGRALLYPPPEAIVIAIVPTSSTISVMPRIAATAS